MLEMTTKDFAYFIGLAIAVAGSHFMLRAKVMVLEERLKGYSKAMQRIFDTLERIETKLDDKADK
ncbi:hypothetical protein C0081_07180 [Cohaesibacter celericrescens]|uniref:Uncharacterized protein n=2 Tax=Cohaesibacter celericrescens TaxID=2067669 RepID=A0A2N5XTR0_9HYPH|nr:hypothetical protein C0081_07180 [Cohaesibacter celericrescens]